MDIEQMKKDLGGGNVFPIGEDNVAFAKYFTGECYLNMLTTERVPVGLVTFAPKTINAYHIHHKGGQILMEQRKTAGSSIWLLKFRQKELPMNGLSFYRKKSMTNYHK